MLKTLLKKQFLEIASVFLLKSNRKGQKRNTVAAVGLVLLMAYAVLASVVLFWYLADSLCAPYHQAGLDWVYFAFTGTTAAAIGCIGSVFMAKNKLYDAKDNDLLLSMPIPPRMLVFVRALSLYLFTALFTSVAFLPACVRYFTLAGITFSSALSCLCIALLLPLGVLAIACVLGCLIALLTARAAKKNLITTVLLLAFLLGYSLLYTRIQDLLNYAVANGAAIGDTLQGIYPLWQLGLGATGQWSGTLIFAGIVIALFALTYALLNATFLPIVTERRTGKHVKYKAKQSKRSSALVALLKKECLRYCKNPMILFNCGLGSVLCLLFVGYACVDRSLLADINASSIPILDITFIATLVLLFCISSNMITASSVSLEGENFYLLRAMPVSTETVFLAKISFHVLYTFVPALLTSVFLFAALHVPFVYALLSIVAIFAATLLFAVTGFAINIKLPYLTWTSEIAAVKQSASPLLTMFVGWGISALLLGGQFWFGNAIGVWYFVVMTAVSGLACVGVCLWLRRRGKEIFESL